MSDPYRADVLIVGAGPTGLVLALWLQKFGVNFHIIDAAEERNTASRALVLHPRTLEFYRQLGIAERIIAAGSPLEQFTVFHNRQPRVVIETSGGGRGLSQYPRSLVLDQAVHELILADVLRERGIEVEHGVVFEKCKTHTNLTNGRNYVTAYLNDFSVRAIPHQGVGEGRFYSYVVGCDGAHSAVRAACAGEGDGIKGGIRLAGGTYARRFYVADVQASGPSAPTRSVQMNLSRSDFCVAIPLPQPGQVRLAGMTPEVPGYDDSDPRQQPPSFTFEDVRKSVAQCTDMHIDKVNWFSHYKVHHRVASSFRYENCFILGDAAHLHSPVGGQGMNTGIGDATNLAWKLATVMRQEKTISFPGFAREALLDTYESERIEFARFLVENTDRVFSLTTGKGILGLILRNIVFPLVIPLLYRLIDLPRIFFKRTSQVAIKYDKSPLSSSGGASIPGKAKLGDRLPFVEHALLRAGAGGGAHSDDEHDPKKPSHPVETDNFSVLQSCTWQFHLYNGEEGAPDAKIPAGLLDLCLHRGIELHAFDWTETVAAAGLARDVAYLVRPDGYIGTAVQLPAFGSGELDASSADRLEKYCNKWDVRKMTA